MIPDVKQLLSFLKNRGYVSSKDALGVYFNKDNIRFSAMSQGSWYTCYYNVNKENQWILMNKSQTLNSYNEALYWIAKEIEKITVGL